MHHKLRRHRPSSAVLSLLVATLAFSSTAVASIVVVNGEDGGAFSGGEAKLSGRLDNYPGIVDGSVTMVFRDSWTIGTAVDSGGGVLTGTYALSPVAPPTQAMVGTINYDTGRWTMNLQPGGFPVNSVLAIDYTYDDGSGGNGGSGTNADLIVSAASGGSVIPEGVHTYSTGTVVQVSATASNHCDFWRWTGSYVPPGEETNATIDVTMDRDRILTANFTVHKAANGTPVWWLAAHGWTSYDEAELGDQDGDGIPTWQEYRFRTNPRDRDTDGDGMDDPLELETWGTDPGSAADPVIVDDDAPGDPLPTNPEVSDPEEDGTAAHPYDAIQEAVDSIGSDSGSGTTGITDIAILGEVGDVCEGGQSVVTGRLGARDIVAGSVALVFRGDEWIIGTVADNGDGTLSGMYSLAPHKEPSHVAKGVVNYATGLWALNLQNAGFPVDAQAHSDYTYHTDGGERIVKVLAEDGGTHDAGETLLAGTLAGGGAETGSVTMVFNSFWSVEGWATDDGQGGLSGRYALAPGAEPTMLMTGTINYGNGAWTLSLESSGFSTESSLEVDYLYAGSVPAEPDYVCVRQPLGPVIADVSTPVTGVIRHDDDIEPGTISFRIGSVIRASDDGAGSLSGPGAAGTVDYDTGLWALTLSGGGQSGLVTNLVVCHSCVDAPDCWHQSVTRNVVLVRDGYYSMTGNYDVTLTNDLWLLSEHGSDHTTVNTDGIGPGFVFGSNTTAETVLQGFRVETASGFGDQPGIVVEDGAPTIQDCRITDCGSYGVVCSNAAQPLLRRVLIDRNNGGIACLESSEPRIENCVVTRNTNQNDGGGMYVAAASAPTVMNCTIARNDATGSGGGIASRGAPKFRNTIIWDNLAATGDSIHRFSGTVDIQNSNIEGGWAGLNIDEDPLFVSVSNCHLVAGSPCIDSGTPAGAPGSDMDRVSRPLDGDNDGTCSYDMGAYEFVHFLADSDGDTQSDASEVIAGTDATNALDYFCVFSQHQLQPGGPLVISWESVLDRIYSVSFRTSLVSGAWEYCPAATNLPGTGYRMTYTNDYGSVGPVFHRIGVRRSL